VSSIISTNVILGNETFHTDATSGTRRGSPLPRAEALASLPQRPITEFMTCTGKTAEEQQQEASERLAGILGERARTLDPALSRSALRSRRIRQFTGPSDGQFADAYRTLENELNAIRDDQRISDKTEATIAKLVDLIGVPSYFMREAAQYALESMGPGLLSHPTFIENARPGAASPEVFRRMGDVGNRLRLSVTPLIRNPGNIQFSGEDVAQRAGLSAATFNEPHQRRWTSAKEDAEQFLRTRAAVLARARTLQGEPRNEFLRTNGILDIFPYTESAAKLTWFFYTQRFAQEIQTNTNGAIRVEVTRAQTPGDTAQRVRLDLRPEPAAIRNFLWVPDAMPLFVCRDPLLDSPFGSINLGIDFPVNGQDGSLKVLATNKRGNSVHAIGAANLSDPGLNPALAP
jgi:hypothetical protein